PEWWKNDAEVKINSSTMSSSAFTCLIKVYNVSPLFLVLYLIQISHGWLPDTSTKVINALSKIPSISFKGNSSFPDHFTVLHQDEKTILLGGRNLIYNLSLFDFSERKDSAIIWPSSEANREMCILKGKTKDGDCQNYIRILFYTAPGKMLVCGTNSYKPQCRILQKKNDKIIVEEEMEGIGLCPYDPDNNSTAVYSNGHVFSATVADFSGTDHLIYRQPLRTEISNLMQLNGPNFVSSMAYGDYIYFFFRETAVEYMNCGKVIYSRVARVCKHDKGGPHLSRGRWTTFFKARLNCSVPGEYPFYFDEIQSTSDIVDGKYGGESNMKIVYSALTTPDNAIGGSAICIYQMEDIQSVFNGPFKHQDGINSNWLPVPENKVPASRPGQCVQDSRVLASENIHFIKTHSIMERAVPALNGQPLLIRVSLNYRFTVVTVDPQVPTIGDETFDVVYIGTDDGKVLKIVHIPSSNASKAFVISENEVFSKGTPIKQLKIAPGYGKVVVVTKKEVKLATLNNCANIGRCSDCIELRDPHCAWDPLKIECVSVDTVTSFRYLIQDVRKGNASKCRIQSSDNKHKFSRRGKRISDPLLRLDVDSSDCNEVDGEKIAGCASQSKLTLYTSEYLHIIVAVASLAGLFVGFLCGYLVSRRFHVHAQYPNPPFIEQHNHLDRLTVNQNSFLAPRTKTVNLDVLNVSTDSLPPKKDNLGSMKNLNITNEGTLQKNKENIHLSDMLVFI
ncbi:hypothetical protein NQ315_013272, partial [Exocentrus adspersus]